MTGENQLQRNMHAASIGKRALQGATIAVVLLTVFFLGAEAPPEARLLLPLAAVALSGACNGVFYFLMDRLRHQGVWQKVVANVICVLVFFFSTWLCLVFALYLVGLWH
jgi:Na+/H+ antiporter NhaD/arsenite permease-like protein